MSVYKPKGSPMQQQANGEGDSLQPAPRRVRNREVERAYARAYYAKHRDRLRAQVAARFALIPIEKRREYGKQWRAKDRIRNRGRYLWVSAKHRAAERGLEFTIDVADIVIPDRCPMLGIPLVIQAGKTPQPDAPSLDRIDNSKGYVPGNVRVISLRANRLKCDMTLEEAQTLVRNWNAR